MNARGFSWSGSSVLAESTSPGTGAWPGRERDRQAPGLQPRARGRARRGDRRRVPGLGAAGV